jgi:acyl carrier protein phosphodiesterase
MKTVIEMAKEAGVLATFKTLHPSIEILVELVRADERNSWPAEMEAMERQVNILTDALADEREACAKVCESIEMKNTRHGPADCAAAIRARSKT